MRFSADDQVGIMKIKSIESDKAASMEVVRKLAILQRTVAASLLLASSPVALGSELSPAFEEADSVQLPFWKQPSPEENALKRVPKNFKPHLGILNKEPLPVDELLASGTILVGQWLGSASEQAPKPSKLVAAKKPRLKAIDEIRLEPAGIAELVDVVKEPLEKEDHSLNCDINQCISLRKSSGKDSSWVAEPRALHLDDESDDVSITWDSDEVLGEDPLLFVRDEDLISWDASQSTLKVHQAGRTEIYVIQDNQMLIIPVIIDAQKAKSKPAINQPELLVDSSLSQGAVQGAHKDIVTYQNAATVGDLMPVIDTTVRFTSQTSPGAVQSESKEFTIESRRATNRPMDISLQLVDDRSIVESQRLYPLEDVTISIAGSQFRKATDVKGQWNVRGMPSSSRFFVFTDDPEGRILPHFYEVSTSLNAPVKKVLKALTYEKYDLYSEVFQFSQDTQLGSLCLTAKDSENSLALADLQTSLSVDADGPYYFNEIGPDPVATSTGRNGRVCYFNIASGLVEISFSKDGEFLTAVNLPTLAGMHSEEVVELWNAPAMEMRLAAFPTATEQLYGVEDFLSIKQVDYSEVLAVGENYQLEYRQDGVLSWVADASYHNHRAYALSEGAEFEPVLYPLDARHYQITEARAVLPLFPRGFTADLYQELFVSESEFSAAFDASLGAVLAYHKIDGGQKNADNVQILLYDENGRKVENGWYFGSGNDGFVKGAFFNLDAGMYQLVIQNSRNEWVESQTIAVDYTMTSYVATGSTLIEPVKSETP